MSKSTKANSEDWTHEAKRAVRRFRKDAARARKQTEERRAIRDQLINA